jgi:hypothetical protein
MPAPGPAVDRPRGLANIAAACGAGATAPTRRAPREETLGIASGVRVEIRGSVVLYELREYTAVPGRLPALVKRFNDHTLELFERFGIDVVFISHTEIGENSTGEIVYLVRWRSYQEIADTWSRFLTDPEWVQVKKDSERDGPLVSAVRRRILNTNPFDGKDG